MITLAASIATFSATALRFRWGISLFVFFLAFTPRSLGLGMAGGSVTFLRIVFPIILTLAILSILSTPHKGFKNSRSGVFAAIYFSFALYFYKIGTTIYNEIPILYAVEDGLYSAIAMYVFYKICSDRMFFGITYAILLALILSLLLALMESFIQQPLHAPFANQEILNEELRGSFRDQRYRIQGLFDGTLMFVEFTVYGLCCTLLYVHRFPKIIQLVSIIILGFILWSTGARSAIIVSFFVFLVFRISLTWPQLSKQSRFFSSLILGGLTLIVLYLAFSVVFDLGSESPLGRYHLMDEVERSTASRAYQYFEVFAIVGEHPFVGVGVHQNFALDLDGLHRIDSYYLRVLLESGIPGLMLFLVFIFLVYRILFVRLRQCRNMHDRRVAAFLISLLAGFVMMKLFLSQPTNNVIFFILIGSGLKVLDNRASPQNVDYDNSPHQ